MSTNTNPVRLDWSRDYFGGREAELEILKSSFPGSTSSSNNNNNKNNNKGSDRRRIFFIQGESGTGKSSLVERAFRDNGNEDNSISDIDSTKNGSKCLVLAKAKFEDSHATTPLQAWIDATESILFELEHDSDFRIHLYKSFQLSSEQSADYLSILASTSTPGGLGTKLRELFETRPKNYRSLVAPRKSQQSFMSLAILPAADLASSSHHRRSHDSFNSSNNSNNAPLSILGEGVVSTPDQKDHSFERLRLAYRELYRVISEYIPIVLFLDDIQWGEPDDFKIMETLLDDPILSSSSSSSSSSPPSQQSSQHPRLIFVGAHRPVGMLHGLNLLKKPGKRVIRNITLSPLQPSETTDVLQKLLQQDDDADLLALTKELDRKTGGNPFFLRQLLQALEDRGMLQYSLAKGRWEWDLKQIQNENAIMSDNVLEFVSQKMMVDAGDGSSKGNQKPTQVGKILSLAAFLGASQISVATLLWILEEETTEVDSEESLQKSLKDAMNMGLIDRVARQEYRFAHDRIRESALTLLLSGESLERMHLRVGLRLRSLWEKDPTNERLLFQVVTQLNSGKTLIKTAKEKYKLAQLNFQAAEAAIQRSAFYPAIHYLRRTKDLLVEEEYEIDIFDFALQTETALARMEYCCGLLDRSITRADAIIKIARDDKVKAEAMHLKAICFTQQNKPLECLEVATEALSAFGVGYPRKYIKFHVVRLYMKSKKLLKNLSDEDILNLPLVQEERYQLASECIPWIGEMATTHGFEDHLACSVLTSVELSIEKGRNSMTAQTLAAWGFILSEEGQIAEGYRYGRLAMKMAEDRIGGTLDDRVPSLYYSWHHHLRHPYVEGVEPFSKALKNLWARGVLEGVVMDTSGYLRLCYLSGAKLTPLLNDMEQFRNLCSDFGMTMARSLIDPFAQMVLNLTDGPCEDMLRGKFMMESTSIKFWKQTNSKIGIQLYYFHKMVVAYYFNSYEMAAKLATKVTHMYLEGADNLVPYRFFFRALAAWTGYGINKRFKYRKLATKMTAEVKKLVDAGVINCDHSLMFLQAERAAALCHRGKSREAVQKAYDEAISAATQRGYLYDRALANERAGQYFIKINDKASAKTYLERAQDCYFDWEANAKAAQMGRRYGELLEPSRRSSAYSQAHSSPLNSKSRLSSIGNTDKLLTIDSMELDESLDGSIEMD